MTKVRALQHSVVLGAGRAGSAVATCLALSGRRVTLLCRDPDRRSRLTGWFERTQLAVAVLPPDAAVPSASPLIFATADRDLRAAASQWAGRHDGVWLHLSGVAPTETLRVAGGARCLGSSHPLCALLDPFAAGGDPEVVARPLRGALFAVAGDERAQRVATSFALACGGNPVVVGEERRDAYHAAAAMVANDLVALLASAEVLCEQAGLPRNAARAGLLHLADSSVRALQVAATPEGRSWADGLTGAVGRGDADTLKGHLVALAGQPDARGAHVRLSRILLDLVADRLAPKEASNVRAALKIDD